MEKQRAKNIQDTLERQNRRTFPRQTSRQCGIYADRQTKQKNRIEQIRQCNEKRDPEADPYIHDRGHNKEQIKEMLKNLKGIWQI